MKSETFYICDLDSVIPPATDKQRYQLQRHHKLNYRQKVDKLIYVMVICRPDIAFPGTKLS